MTMPAHNRNTLMLKRDDRFSPNSVEKDLSILQAVAHNLPYSKPTVIEEAELLRLDNSYIAANYELIVSMARLPEVLIRLEELRNMGLQVVNSGESVMRCQRGRLEQLMRENSIQMPPVDGEHGWWIKRGDAAAQSKDDVKYCPDEEALQKAKTEFAKRGIEDFVVSAHVVGDVVKFYGVGERFFRFFYPTDDGQTKFGDENVNGNARHYSFDRQQLQDEAVRLARLVGIDVYGGDAIIDEKGQFYIIDFNDWPSFSRCRDDAAKAIAELIESETN